MSKVYTYDAARYANDTTHQIGISDCEVVYSRGKYLCDQIKSIPTWQTKVTKTEVDVGLEEYEEIVGDLDYNQMSGLRMRSQSKFPLQLSIHTSTMRSTLRSVSRSCSAVNTNMLHPVVVKQSKVNKGKGAVSSKSTHCQVSDFFGIKITALRDKLNDITLLHTFTIYVSHQNNCVSRFANAFLWFYRIENKNKVCIYFFSFFVIFSAISICCSSTYVSHQSN